LNQRFFIIRLSIFGPVEGSKNLTKMTGFFKLQLVLVILLVGFWAEPQSVVADSAVSFGDDVLVPLGATTKATAAPTTRNTNGPTTKLTTRPTIHPTNPTSRPTTEPISRPTTRPTTGTTKASE